MAVHILLASYLKGLNLGLARSVESIQTGSGGEGSSQINNWKRAWFGTLDHTVAI